MWIDSSVWSCFQSEFKLNRFSDSVAKRFKSSWLDIFKNKNKHLTDSSIESKEFRQENVGRILKITTGVCQVDIKIVIKT